MEGRLRTPRPQARGRGGGHTLPAEGQAPSHTGTLPHQAVVGRPFFASDSNASFLFESSHLYLGHRFPSAGALRPHPVGYVSAESKDQIKGSGRMEAHSEGVGSAGPRICPVSLLRTPPHAIPGSPVLANRPLIAHLQLDKMLDAERVQSQKQDFNTHSRLLLQN